MRAEALPARSPRPQARAGSAEAEGLAVHEGCGGARPELLRLDGASAQRAEEQLAQLQRLLEGRGRGAEVLLSRCEAFCRQAHAAEERTEAEARGLRAAAADELSSERSWRALAARRLQESAYGHLQLILLQWCLLAKSEKLNHLQVALRSEETGSAQGLAWRAVVRRQQAATLAQLRTEAALREVLAAWRLGAFGPRLGRTRSPCGDVEEAGEAVEAMPAALAALEENSRSANSHSGRVLRELSELRGAVCAWEAQTAELREEEAERRCELQAALDEALAARAELGEQRRGEDVEMARLAARLVLERCAVPAMAAAEAAAAGQAVAVGTPPVAALPRWPEEGARRAVCEAEACEELEAELCSASASNVQLEHRLMQLHGTITRWEAHCAELGAEEAVRCSAEALAATEQVQQEIGIASPSMATEACLESAPFQPSLSRKRDAPEAVSLSATCAQLWAMLPEASQTNSVPVEHRATSEAALNGHKSAVHQEADEVKAALAICKAQTQIVRDSRDCIEWQVLKLHEALAMQHTQRQADECLESGRASGRFPTSGTPHNIPSYSLYPALQGQHHLQHGLRQPGSYQQDMLQQKTPVQDPPEQIVQATLCREVNLLKDLLASSEEQIQSFRRSIDLIDGQMEELHLEHFVHDPADTGTDIDERQLHMGMLPMTLVEDTTDESFDSRMQEEGAKDPEACVGLSTLPPASCPHRASTETLTRLAQDKESQTTCSQDMEDSTELTQNSEAGSWVSPIGEVAELRAALAAAEAHTQLAKASSSLEEEELRKLHLEWRTNESEELQRYLAESNRCHDLEAALARTAESEAMCKAEHAETSEHYVEQLWHLQSKLQTLEVQACCLSEDRMEVRQAAASQVASWEEMLEVVEESQAHMRLVTASGEAAHRRGKRLQATLLRTQARCAFTAWHREVCLRQLQRWRPRPHGP